MTFHPAAKYCRGTACTCGVLPDDTPVQSDRVKTSPPAKVNASEHDKRDAKLINSRGTCNMPLYLDIREHVPGLTAVAVTGAHAQDLKTQGKHGVKYLKYWFDEDTGKVFCLVEAPTKEAAAAVHREAHGLVADEISEVQEGT